MKSVPFQLSKEDAISLISVISVIALILHKNNTFLDSKDKLHELLQSGLTNEELVELFLIAGILHETKPEIYAKLNHIFENAEKENLHHIPIDLQILIEDVVTDLTEKKYDNFLIMITALSDQKIITIEELAWLNLLRDLRNTASHKSRRNSNDSVSVVFLKTLQIYLKLIKLVFEKKK